MVFRTNDLNRAGSFKSLCHMHSKCTSGMGRILSMEFFLPFCFFFVFLFFVHACTSFSVVPYGVNQLKHIRLHRLHFPVLIKRNCHTGKSISLHSHALVSKGFVRNRAVRDAEMEINQNNLFPNFQQMKASV